MRQIVLVAHNLRSAHNVGSLLRTAEGLGVFNVILSGYTPYPLTARDDRLPHEAAKTDKQISKTALGAEKTQRWQRQPEITKVVDQLKKEGFSLIALEQSPKALLLSEFNPPRSLAVFLGNEVTGLDQSLVDLCDQIVAIPMLGQKESYNVTVAAAMALYRCRYP